MRIRGHYVGRRSIMTTGVAASAGVLVAAGGLVVVADSQPEEQPQIQALAEVHEAPEEPVESTAGPAEEAPEGLQPVAREDGPLGLPGVALDAYYRASHALANERPECGISWALLAGIGQVESKHANGKLHPDGFTDGRVLGPRLDGSIPGTATIRDTDGGRFDGDDEYDRAVGPMQFIPQTWEKVGRDARGGDDPDPNNIYDAALSSGTLLCKSGGHMDDEAARDAAIFSYNASEAYVQNVVAWMEGYLTDTMPAPEDLPEIHPPRPEIPEDCPEGTEGEPTGPPEQAEGDEEAKVPGCEKPEPSPSPEPEPEPEPSPEPRPEPEGEQAPPPPPEPVNEEVPPPPPFSVCPPICLP